MQHLVRRHDAADHGAEDGEAVVTRPRAEDEIEGDAKSSGDEARPLQDADRAMADREPS